MSEPVDAAVERNRRAFADPVDGLSEEELARPSLRDGWDCRTVAGHLAAAGDGGSSGGEGPRTTDQSEGDSACRPA